MFFVVLVNFLLLDPGSPSTDPDPGELNQCESMPLRIWIHNTGIRATGKTRKILGRNVGELYTKKRFQNIARIFLFLAGG